MEHTITLRIDGAEHVLSVDTRTRGDRGVHDGGGYLRPEPWGEPAAEPAQRPDPPLTPPLTRPRDPTARQGRGPASVPDTRDRTDSSGPRQPKPRKRVPASRHPTQ
ncbi:hypothetical protein GCM10025784_16380 [Citricoccus nitrophenolicus]